MEIKVASIEQSLAHPWRDEIFKSFKAAGINQVAYVPDAGHTARARRPGDGRYTLNYGGRGGG